MKKIYLIAILAMPLFSAAQTMESRLDSLESNVREIKLNLDKSQKQHEVGVGLITGGSVLCALAITQLNSPKDISASRWIVAGSALVATAGWVIVFDSHKFIGRAGLRK